MLTFTLCTVLVAVDARLCAAILPWKGSRDSAATLLHAYRALVRLAHVRTLAQKVPVTRKSSGFQALSQPYLAVMDSVPATLRIGIHIRVGDSAVANAIKKGDKRYQPGCDRPTRSGPLVLNMAVTPY